jgi:hypothetical protein
VATTIYEISHGIACTPGKEIKVSFRIADAPGKSHHIHVGQDFGYALIFAECLYVVMCIKSTNHALTTLN